MEVTVSGEFKQRNVHLFYGVLRLHEMAGWKLTGNHSLHPTQTIILDLDLIVVESKVSGGCELDQRNEINYAIIVSVLKVHVGTGGCFKP